MAAPSSPLDVCNLSLSLLRQQPISSVVHPTTGPERICAQWYDHKRRTTLRKHVWNFALKRANLAALEAAPAFGYTQNFELPTDYIRIVGIGENNIDEYEHDIEDAKILIDWASGALPLRYVYDHTNISKWDPLFIDVFAIELAIGMCTQATGSFSLGEGLVQQLSELAPEAYAIDGQERPPDRVENSRIKTARRRGVITGDAGTHTVFED